MVSCKDQKTSHDPTLKAPDSLMDTKTQSDQNHVDSSASNPEVLKFTSHLSFKDFKVDTLENAQKAPIDFTSNANATDFKTRVVNAYQSDKANFAGHYTFVFWGCGTACQSGLLVDRNTGKIFDVPTASLGYEFYPDSRLLMVNPPDSDGLYQNCSYCKPMLYVFDETTKTFKEQKD